MFMNDRGATHSFVIQFFRLEGERRTHRIIGGRLVESVPRVETVGKNKAMITTNRRESSTLVPSKNQTHYCPKR